MTRRTYTGEERQAAVDALEAEGIADASRRLGIPRRTVARWAKVAGVDVSEEARAKTAAARAALEAKVAEVNVTTVTRLEAILALELDVLEELGYLEATFAAEQAAAPVRLVETVGGNIPQPVPGSDLETILARIELIRRAVGKRDLVGAIGLIVDKLEVLASKATGRGDLIVRFGIPRPSFYEADRDCIDLPPLDQ